MAVSIEVACRFCGEKEVVFRHGTGHTGKPRYRCRDCQRSFQLEYAYKACHMGTQAKIEAMTLNGSGVSDIVRVLGIGKNTVIRALKNSRLRQSTQEKTS